MLHLLKLSKRKMSWRRLSLYAVKLTICPRKLSLYPKRLSQPHNLESRAKPMRWILTATRQSWPWLIKLVPREYLTSLPWQLAQVRVAMWWLRQTNTSPSPVKSLVIETTVNLKRKNWMCKSLSASFSKVSRHGAVKRSITHPKQSTLDHKHMKS